MLVFNVYHRPDGTQFYMTGELWSLLVPEYKLVYRIRCRFKPSALSWCDDQHSLLYDDKVAH